MCNPLLGSVLAGLMLGCSGDVVEEPVASGDTALPETSDPLTTGTVDVTIEGLPPDVKADVTLVGGPSDRSRDVTASRSIEVEAGAWVLTASAVDDEGARYLPDPTRVEIELTVGQTVAVDVSYVLDVPAAVDGQRVAGPGFEAYFGWSVDIDDDVAIAGAPNEGGSFAGAAHVIRRDGTDWVIEDRLRIDDVLERLGSAFGQDVAIQGDTAVVGAPGYADDAGAIYVFEYSGAAWSDGTRLTCGNPQTEVSRQKLGEAVALDGDTIVASAPGFPSYSCTFRRSGEDWVFEDTLDVGGDDVSLEGDTLWVAREGAPWRFTRSGGIWSGEERDITLEEQAWPARTVAHTGDLVVLGHPSWPKAGRAVLSSASGAWSDVVLEADEVVDGDRFGEGVAVSGDRIVVTAPTEENDATDGAAYLFDSSGSPLARLVATDPDEDISFGEAVAIQGRTAIVGAWKHPAEGSPDRGVVYFFDLP